MAQWLSWLERRPVTAEVTGSSPVWVVDGLLTFVSICDIMICGSVVLYRGIIQHYLGS